MRKIVATEFVALDGVVESPGGNETAHPHGGWNNSHLLRDVASEIG